MNTITENRGKRLSFCGLFSQDIQQVEIPIIQRDYAQGRENEKEIRDNFLETLYQYLDQYPDKQGDLDFIYGIVPEERKMVFIPLDGQQRLTTLFLLSWFLYLISTDQPARECFQQIFMRKASVNDDRISPPLTYATRESSKAFCEGLINSNIEVGSGKKISQIIQNEPWFFRYWLKDPTILSMLHMLDCIEEKFSDRVDFLTALMDTDNEAISFTFMDLPKFNLTDDIYLKMNSRDKPLTNFETFKANLIKYVKNECQDCSKVSIFLGSMEKEFDLDKYISQKFDTEWTALIWNYCIPDKQVELDKYFGNLIWALITAIGAEKKKSAEARIDFPREIRQFQDFISPDRRPDLTFYNYKNANILECGIIAEMAQSLDALAANQPLERAIPSKYGYYFPSEIFTKILEGKATYPQRLQFYAFVSYLRQYGQKNIGPWVRVIHNLSNGNNTPTETPQNFVRGVRAIQLLLPHASDIISYLAGKGGVEYFSLPQREEEIIKAVLIAKGETWLDAIMAAEKRPWFEGQICLILQLAGIYDYYTANGTLDWSDAENDHFLQNFIKYSLKAGAIFPAEQNRDWNYCFERAVLTKGDYLPEDYGGHKNLLSSKSGGYNIPRDWSWRRWLRHDHPDCGARIKLVKAVLDDAAFKAHEPVSSLEAICQGAAGISGWRKLMISQPQLFDCSGFGFIEFNYPIMLLSKRYIGSYHVQLYSYALWLNELEPKDWQPWKKDYIRVYGPNSQPCARFFLSRGEMAYCLDIIAEMDGQNFKDFLFSFYAGSNNSITDNDVLGALAALSFATQNGKSFEVRKNDAQSALALVTSLHTQWLGLPG